MEKKAWFTGWWFYALMGLYFILGFSTLEYGADWAARLYPEDHYFENVGAISLFVASAICLYVFIQALRHRKSAGIHWMKLLVYLGLALLFFFGGGEEISWGQRIFHIKEPATLAQENTQHELNVHNLTFIEKNKVLKADNLFSVFWMGFAVLLPAAGLLSGRFKSFAAQMTPIVYWGIGALFLLNYLFAKLAKDFLGHTYTYQVITFQQAVQEIKESNYELLFVFLGLIVLWDLGRLLIAKRPAKSEAPV